MKKIIPTTAATGASKAPKAPAIPRPKFMFGAEFEGAIKADYYDEFCDGLRRIHPKINIGEDGSLIFHNSLRMRTVEIRTPVLTFAHGLDLFEEMLSYFTLLSHAGLFKTNSTCGLHLNISEKRLFSQPPVGPWDRITPNSKTIQFYCNVLSRFDDEGVAKRFNRLQNRYAKLVKATNKNVDEVRGLYDTCLHSDKYLSAALRPLTQYNPSVGHRVLTNKYRVEFRCLGNTNYHLRHNDIKESIEHIQSCINESYTKCV